LRFTLPALCFCSEFRGKRLSKGVTRHS
jgi:hypothetical protein